MTVHHPVPETVARYLSRLGLPANLAPTAENLAVLQRRHLDAVRSGGGAFTRDLGSYDDWRAALEYLGVSFAGIAGHETRLLHARMLAAHGEWAAASRR